MKYKIKKSSALQRAGQMSAAVILYTLCLLLFMLSGCGKEDVIFLTVYDTPSYSFQSDVSSGEVVLKRTMVAIEEGSDVELNLELNAIRNFTYETGNEYYLKVKRKTKNNDGSYSLDEIVSKTQKYELKTVLLHATIEHIGYGGGQEPVERMIIKEEEEELPGGYLIPASFKIEGFECEKGFDYLLKVKKTVVNTPAQMGFLRFYLYEFVEIISKTPKSQ